MAGISEDCGVGQAAAGPARSEPAVSVRGLVKRYAGHEAVAGIDLQVRRERSSPSSARTARVSPLPDCDTHLAGFPAAPPSAATLGLSG
jgi:hypothetical protein